MINRLKLQNNLPILYQKTDLDIFAVSFNVKMGSIYEQENEKGFSHFLEHIVFNKTRKFDQEGFFTFCDDNGFSYNAVTHSHLVSFYLVGHKSKFHKAIEALEEICCYPILDDELIEIEKSIVFQEIERDLDDLSSFRWTLNLDKYFESGYHDPLGTKEDISSIDPKKMLHFKNKFLKSNNCFLAIAGNFNDNDILNVINKTAFKNLEEGKIIEPKNLVVAPKKIHKQHFDSTEQIYLTYAFDFPFTTKENFVIHKLVSSILGESGSSVMNKILRNREGLAYSLGSTVNYWTNLNTNMMLYIDIEKSQLQRTLDLIDNEIIPELKNVTQDVLNRNLTILKTNSLLSLEKTINKMFKIIRNEVDFKEYISLQEVHNLYDSISLDQIKEFINEYIKDPMINIVGNLK